jgi:hypothetical protein
MKMKISILLNVYRDLQTVKTGFSNGASLEKISNIFANRFSSSVAAVCALTKVTSPGLVLLLILMAQLRVCGKRRLGIQDHHSLACRQSSGD